MQGEGRGKWGWKGRERRSLWGEEEVERKGKREREEEEEEKTSSFPPFYLSPPSLPPYFSSSLVSCSWDEDASTAARKEAKSSLAFAS